MTYRTPDEDRLVQIFEKLGFEKFGFARERENHVLMGLLQESQGGRVYVHFEGIVNGGILTIKLFSNKNNTDLVLEYEPWKGPHPSWYAPPVPRIADAILESFAEAVQQGRGLRFSIPHSLELDRGRVEYLYSCPVAPGGGPSMLGI